MSTMDKENNTNDVVIVNNSSSVVSQTDISKLYKRLRELCRSNNVGPVIVTGKRSASIDQWLYTYPHKDACNCHLNISALKRVSSSPGFKIPSEPRSLEEQRRLEVIYNESEWTEPVSN